MKILLLFLALFVTVYTVSQDGGLDASFGDDGTVRTDINGGTDLAYSIAQQANGKLLVAGMSTIQNKGFPSIVRYGVNGDLDTSFGINAVATFNRSEYENVYYDIVLNQSDGKIIAACKLYVNSNYQYIAHRFLSNGSIDVNFGNNGEVVLFPQNIFEKNMVLLEDDSFVVGGNIVDNGISKMALKKYLPNGTLDVSFGNNGMVITAAGNESSSARKIALAQDNTIVVLADRRDNGVYSQVLLRYLPNGILDDTFGSDGMKLIENDPDFSARNIALYIDGKIAVASSYFDHQFERVYNSLSRYLPNGSYDTSFGNNGVVNPGMTTLVINKIEVQQNQRLLLFGELSDFMEGGGPFFMSRYYIDGNLDYGFSFANTQSQYFVTDMLTQQDGKIVCLAHTPWYDGQEDIIMERHLNNPLSVPEFEVQKTIIYPNPSNGIFTIQQTFLPENRMYQISDVLGKIILSGELYENDSTIDLSAVQSGIYFLKTQAGTLRLLKN